MRVRSMTVFTVSILVALTLSACAASAHAASVPVKKGTAAPGIFAPAKSCGCHGQLRQEWSQSMHAKALTDPLFLAKVAEGNAATDGRIGDYCNTCHGPVATMGGEVGSAAMSPGSADAIGCSFCHHLTGNAGEPANTSQLVATDGVRRAQIKDPQAPHPAGYSEFQTRAELCGGCHNVDHPVNGMHLESTYSEWKKGPYAEQGIQCQDCHMSEAPGKIGPSTGYAANGGVERDNIYHMQFVGGQVALGNPQMATARLKSAATIGLDGPDVVAPGAEATVTVTVTNSGAGHYLPTGLTEVRQMWLEIYGESADGTRTKLAERRFGTVLADDKGNAPVELWDATTIKSDDRIPPKESVSEPVSFQMPQGAEHGTVSAVLYYRSAPDELAQKAQVENPTTEMAAGRLDIYASQDIKAAAEKAAEEKPVTKDTSKAVSAPGLLLWVALGLATLTAAAAGLYRWGRSRHRG